MVVKKKCIYNVIFSMIVFYSRYLDKDQHNIVVPHYKAICYHNGLWWSMLPSADNCVMLAWCKLLLYSRDSPTVVVIHGNLSVHCGWMFMLLNGEVAL